jgi:cytochrome c5
MKLHMKKNASLTALALIPIACLTLLTSCYYDNEEDLYGGAPACDTAAVSYAASVAPVLQNNCTSCHSGNFPSAGIRLDSYESVRTQALNGRLYGSVAHLPGFSAMPEGGKLSECNIALIGAWVNQGASNN